jgi:hypothetical protein
VFVQSDSVRVNIAVLAAVRAIALEARLGHRGEGTCQQKKGDEDGLV